MGLFRRKKEDEGRLGEGVNFIDDKERDDFILIVGNLVREGAHRIIVHGSSLRGKNHNDVDVYAEYSRENAEKAGVDVRFGTSIYRIEGDRSGRVFDVRRTVVPFELSDVGNEGQPKIVLFRSQLSGA